MEFRAMADAVEGYRLHTSHIQYGWIQLDCKSIDMFVTKDVPLAVVHMHLTKKLRDAPLAFLEFREMSKGLLDACKFRLPPKFRVLLQLPPELRALVIHEYLLLERQAGRLSKHCHYDDYGHRCCVWEYPDALIACDNQNPTTFPPPETARAPQGWLPALAFTSKAMLGEVTVHMLRGTERFDLKYIKDNPDFKIATWLRQFIAAIPGDDSANAVKYLNFPHMHWFNSARNPPAPTNPSVELMVHQSMLSKPDPYTGVAVPLTAIELVEYYHLHAIFDCLNLRELYLDGIYRPPRFGGMPQDLISPDRLARWIKKGFLVWRNQAVQVEIVRRHGKWMGRTAGTIINLDEKDLLEVAARIAAWKGEVLGPADVRSHCAFPLLM